jgi:hypothetical protein
MLGRVPLEAAPGFRDSPVSPQAIAGFTRHRAAAAGSNNRSIPRAVVSDYRTHSSGLMRSTFSGFIFEKPGMYLCSVTEVE